MSKCDKNLILECLYKPSPTSIHGNKLHNLSADKAPLGGSGLKQQHLLLKRDHWYFIPTKLHQNPSSGSGEECESMKSLQTDERTMDGAI